MILVQEKIKEKTEKDPVKDGRKVGKRRPE
jgi:hypothetical protein